MQCLELSAVDVLIIWESLDFRRIFVVNPHSGEEQIHLASPEQAQDENLYRCAETGVELDVISNESFLDWIVDNYRSWGARLELVSDRSQEGCQFVKGFNGIGGLLRYPVELELLDEGRAEAEDSDEDFM